jgi:class 3 adenylate cyclase
MQDGGFASGGAIAVIVVLAVLLVGVIVGLVLVVRRLQRAERRVGLLEAEIEEAGGDTGEIPALPKSLGRAERAMRTMVEAAFKVRDQGVGGLLMESMDNLSRWAIEDRSEITKMAARDGTVTVFFSDIEGSTALNSELGDEGWVRLLIAHDTLVRAEVERRDGHIVKSQGDGFMVVFTSPVDAVKAGLSIQGAMGGLRSGRFKRTPLKVRIGIHEGTAIARDGDLFGQTVAMAARVGAEAKGDEILVTEPVAAALAGNARFELTECDPVELKGLPDKHVLWRVASARS